jgi:cytochrome c biogenesis protein CcmG/thiol:disulfide interchange protein DsbE
VWARSASHAGRAALEWGVYGVPDTFVVKGAGTIVYELVGPMDEQSLRGVALPQIEAEGR